MSARRIGNISGGNAVTVAWDDYADFYTFETDYPEPYPPDFAGPHTILTLYPVGPGDSTELGVGAGTGENWEVNAEPIADGDGSYVSKSAGSEARDLYALGPPAGVELPELPPDYEAPDEWQFHAMVWGLMREDGGLFGVGSVLVAFTDPEGTYQQYTNRRSLPDDGSWKFIGNRVGSTAPEIASLQAGYGPSLSDVVDVPEVVEDAYSGSQVVGELWYPAPPVPPVAGGGPRWAVGLAAAPATTGSTTAARWAVGWLPTAA
jgi:hypothetical protein